MGSPDVPSKRNWASLTADGKGHFRVVELPEERVPSNHFLLSTRRGKQFNSIINAEVDPITGARRDDVPE